MHSQSAAGKSKYPFGLIPFYFFISAGNAVFQTFFSLYLDSIGFSSQQIGLVQGLTPVFALLGQPIWGFVGDKVKYKNYMLIGLLIGAIAMALTLSLSVALLFVIGVAGMYTFFHSAIGPVGDTITLETLEHQGRPFGPIRMVGTIAYACTSPLSGLMMQSAGDSGGNLNTMIYVLAGLHLFTIIAVLFMPKVRGHQSESGNKMSMWSLFKNKDIVFMLSFFVVMMISMTFFYNFFSIYFTQDLGGSKQMLGWCYFISAMSEVPFLLLSDKIYKKFGPGKMLMASSVIIVARWLILGFTGSWVVAMISQVMHSGCFIVMMFTMAKFMIKNAPPELAAAGQLLVTLFGMSVARIISGLMGGFIAEHWGRPSLFLTGAAMMALAVVFFGWRIIKSGKAQAQKA